MKAIILSAGQGSRLGRLVDETPKCLVSIHGRTLLDRQLDTLEANGVPEAVIVTGFCDHRVEEALASRESGPVVRTIYNPFFKVADNAGSLYMAREELTGDCLVWNGDTLVSNRLMARVLENLQSGICVTIDRKTSYDEDDMKVIERAGRVLAIGKRLPLKEVNAESIGLVAIRGTGTKLMREAIERAMRTPEGTIIWYLRIIHDLARRTEVSAIDIAGEEWAEVDFPADLERACEIAGRWDRRNRAEAA